jgi:hypothetical protein
MGHGHGCFRQFLPPIVFVAEDRVVHSLLEELIQQMQQFETAEDFQRLLPHALQFQEIPEISFNHHDAPAQRAQSDSLLSPAPAESLVNSLDIVFGLGQEPIAEVAVDLIGSLADLVFRNFAQVGGPPGTFQLV